MSVCIRLDSIWIGSDWFGFVWLNRNVPVPCVSHFSTHSLIFPNQTLLLLCFEYAPVRMYIELKWLAKVNGKLVALKVLRVNEIENVKNLRAHQSTLHTDTRTLHPHYPCLHTDFSQWAMEIRFRFTFSCSISWKSVRFVVRTQFKKKQTNERTIEQIKIKEKPTNKYLLNFSSQFVHFSSPLFFISLSLYRTTWNLSFWGSYNSTAKIVRETRIPKQPYSNWTPNNQRVIDFQFTVISWMQKAWPQGGHTEVSIISIDKFDIRN